MFLEEKALLHSFHSHNVYTKYYSCFTYEETETQSKKLVQGYKDSKRPS